MFAILCAETVLKYYENKHPKDKRPRDAIEAAKKYLKRERIDAAAYAAYAAAAENLDFASLANQAVKTITEEL